MHYEDLAPCDYFSGFRAGDALRAVGWLERGHTYNRGEVEDRDVRRLAALLSKAWQGMFLFCGGHACSLCDSDPFRSFGNLFVPRGKVILVSPEAILHYITVHDYLPPRSYFEALHRCPPMRSEQYFEALLSAGLPKRLIRLKRS